MKPPLKVLRAVTAVTTAMSHRPAWPIAATPRSSWG